MKLHSILVGGAALILTTTAYATELPVYDPNAYCENLSTVSGGSATIKNQCIAMEQSSYNNLKQSWESIPGKTQTYCQNLARTAGNSYTMLENCIQMESSALKAPPKFQF